MMIMGPVTLSYVGLYVPEVGNSYLYILRALNTLFEYPAKGHIAAVD